MSVAGQIRSIADAAWESMRHHAIVATPRNYEIWYAFCGTEKPLLTQRIDALLRSGQPVTPGFMDQVYREFFSTHADVTAVREGSGVLQQIAMDMVDNVSADRTMIDTLGRALGSWSSHLQTVPMQGELSRTATTLGNASMAASDRLAALEQLLKASMKRIFDLKEKLVKAERDATRDALTGLSNRRMFDTALLLAANQANENQSEFSLLLLDIDHFKKFNDTYGHTLGDNVLRLVGRVLLDQVKGRDTAARYGGEEFAIILTSAGLSGGVTVAKQIRTTLERRPIVNRTSGQSFGVITCSIGAGVYRLGEPVGDLVDRVDQALYRAKREGRNIVRTEGAPASPPDAP